MYWSEHLSFFFVIGSMGAQAKHDRCVDKNGQTK